jgi:bifunctional non-homologous end joining protein LigD
MTRGGLDWSERFPDIVEAVRSLGRWNGVLDGEVIALDQDGLSDFQRLQASFRDEGRSERRFVVFDLLRDGATDVTSAPLDERKARLAQVFSRLAEERSTALVLSAGQVGGGAAFLKSCCERGLEGMVSKRRDAPYVPGRGSSWVKVKCERRQEFVIGGFTRPKGSRVGLGALLVGTYERGALVYAGKVGTGFDRSTLRALTSRLAGMAIRTAAFSRAGKQPKSRDVVWVEPELVAEVRFTGWTRDRQLRHPTFLGLREDKRAQDVVIEVPSAAPQPESPSPVDDTAKPVTPTKARRKTVAKAETKSTTRPAQNPSVTHPERLVFPADGVTKGDVAAYYQAVAPHLLPYVAGRPLTILRCPRDVGSHCFVQRHLPRTRDEAWRFVTLETDNERGDYLVIDDAAGLAALSQLSVVELHPWASRADAPDAPDYAEIDLDPGTDVAWRDVVALAEATRKEAAALGLTAFVKTSGGRGLHVLITFRASWAECEMFARFIAGRLLETHPQLVTTKAGKAARPGRIYVDALRNVRGATTVAAFSVRARSGAQVSMPLSWEALRRTDGPEAFTVRTVPGLLARRKNDPWKGFAAAMRKPLLASLKRRMAKAGV